MAENSDDNEQTESKEGGSMNKILATAILGAVCGVSLALWGCTSYSLQTADGKNTVTDSSPLDSVVSISTGPGCTVPNPYIPPTPPAPPPVVAKQMCDQGGKDCANFLVPIAAADNPNLCTTTVAQTKGIGLQGGVAVLASIFAMILLGVGSGGF